MLEVVSRFSYVAVHVRGKAHVIEQPQAVYSILKTTVRHFESKYGTGWNLPVEPNEELTSLLKAIVAFRIDIQDIQGKFKLSQKQGPIDRNTAIEHLTLVGGADRVGVVEYMKMVLQQGPK
jgi:transcriptional regulator